MKKLSKITTTLLKLSKEKNSILCFLKSKEKSLEIQEKRVSGYIVALTTVLARIFRCLLAYVNYRLNKIKDKCWENGGNISTENQTFMSEKEKEFYAGYKKAILEYEESYPVEIGLYKDLQPPGDLLIQILVLEECGEIMTSNGDRLVLEKGTTLSVRKCDVEHLLHQNSVVQTG